MSNRACRNVKVAIMGQMSNQYHSWKDAFHNYSNLNTNSSSNFIMFPHSTVLVTMLDNIASPDNYGMLNSVSAHGPDRLLSELFSKPLAGSASTIL